MSTSRISPAILEPLVNHLTLPARLPGQQDSRLYKIEQDLTSLLLDATKELQSAGLLVDSLRQSLQTSRVINASGRLLLSSLLTALRELPKSEFLVLHIVEQNAALVIRRDHPERNETVLFEAFEASARSEDVLASKSALQWDFPGCAVALPISEFEKPSFQTELAKFLEKASIESIKRFAACTNKAGSFTYETRDSVNPSLITQMLMTLLQVNGTRVYPSLLRKRVRDDVSWDGAENPWRRAPFWLVLRVAAQRHLTTLLGGGRGRIVYKFAICLVLAHILVESLNHLSPELVVHIRAKLCRRIVKLEVEKQGADVQLREHYVYMLGVFREVFLQSTATATKRLEDDWATFRRSIQRPVLPLPRRADERHLHLTLPNSASYLRNVLTVSLHRQAGFQSSITYTLAQHYDVSTTITKPGTAFANRYFVLSEIENKIERDLQSEPEHGSHGENRCLSIARLIKKYLAAAAGAYDFNPEQKSVMILRVMELWASLDRVVIKLFPLLRDYHLGFQSIIMDVLQLSRLQDMSRLQEIRAYIQERNATCKDPHKTLFGDPEKGCFAERYYDESTDSLRLGQLRQQIETAAEQARAMKEREWEDKCVKYEELVRQIAGTACLYVTDHLNIKVHASRQCKKCFHERERERFRIQAHEHPLPTNPVHAKAVVFELGCPKELAAYRDITWRIISTLALATLVEGDQPKEMLKDYSELRAYSQSMTSQFSLVSEKKSFLKTHYARRRFPVDLTDVCLPNGLKQFKYYDTTLNIWPGRQSKKTSFAHHCGITLPPTSPYASLLLSPEFSADGSGLSSYQVVASQTKCPSGLNVHEFMAFQSLVSGRTRRWPQILVELGSTNLNFSAESTTLLMGLLALQVGPSHKIDPLGAVHVAFRDEAFCKRFVEQLDQRLDNISPNYREVNCMETIISFILRLTLLADSFTAESVKLLEKARITTFNWLKALRSEVQIATDADISQRCSRYACWSALLCKRTFAIYVERGQLLEPPALRCFIECSITLQDNLVSDPATLPLLLRNALIRDLKMVHRMGDILRRSLEASPSSLVLSLESVWPDTELASTRSFSRFEFLEGKNQGWVKVTIDATSKALEQTIHFHLLEGHLLVMGKPVGKLPAEHRTSAVLQQLFGNQSLLTYPSSLPGMTYMLAILVHGHQIHLGFRNRMLVVRALVQNTVLELIPQDKFGNLRNFDLPASLLMNCVHWLDLETGIIEVRQQPDIWKSKPSNWTLNFYTRSATRRNVTLVDPQSPLFSRIARIFDRFEYRHHLTVFQPHKVPLSVELRRLELTFVVNGRNLLESPQLQAEIVIDQDAGTWYGLSSKIVMKDVIRRRDPRTQRFIHSTPGRQISIIVPIGDIRYKRYGPHVIIDVQNDGSYGRYTVNPVLKRLDCPAEPRLLYLKAQFHAYTSFVLPDSLTGRTGTEEAIPCLKSGYCQPWTPLTVGPQRSLHTLSKLTPRREYYPKDLKVMQKTLWDPQLTASIQHDSLRAVVQDILAKSEQLSMFASQKDEILSLEHGGEIHLTSRSQLRREAYERPNDESGGQQAFPDLEYFSRDRWINSPGRLNVIESTALIRDWPSKICTTQDLAGILQGWVNIGGCSSSFDKVLLSDLLNVQFDAEWGSIANLCRSCTFEDGYRLMFLFGIISFRQEADMAVVRTLISFALLMDLKHLQPPSWPGYNNFRPDHVPGVDYLVQLMSPCLTPYGGDERSTFEFVLGFKLRKKLECAELAHQQQQKNDATALANFLLEQWPCSELTIEGFSRPVLINIADAMDIIRPEWQRLSQNLELSKYIAQVQLVLDQHRATATVLSSNIEVREQEVLPTRIRGGEFPTLKKTLLRKTVLRPHTSAMFALDTVVVNHSPTHVPNSQRQKTNNILTSPISPGHKVPQVAWEIDELNKIIDQVTRSKSAVRQQYGNDLKQSLDALRGLKNLVVDEGEVTDLTNLSEAILKARNHTKERLNWLQETFERDDSRVIWLQQGGLWPIITPVTVLENLRSISRCVFGDGMKELITAYALCITSLQRLIRIEDAQQKSQYQRMIEEQRNLGHTNWNPQDQPDWLLLEIDANMLIRPVQVDVTLATTSPYSGSNSVLQMNMGQGKTSCIIPMSAVSLANGKSLLRVVIPKSLLLQTAQLLQARLGGLVGREIRHVPFSRKTPTHYTAIQAFHRIHKDIRDAHGVMLALPEHLLSFKLSGLQRLSDGRINEAKTMIKVQDWLTGKARDVLDECDSILAIRTQLIYPSGSQTTVDGHPHRWEIAEALLNRVSGHLWNLQKDYPRSIEVRRPQGGFPVAFFLRKDVEDQLIARLVDDIYHQRISILPSQGTNADLLVIKQFISDAKVSAHVAKSIQKIYPDNPSVKQTLHLLRGLFVHRILLMTLKKRWNVQYGLHPGRDPIAVPYTAKGCPSEQAEWGHPDVAILFTCLAFYYDGLSVPQLRQTLDHVLKSDDPSQTYDRFSQGSNLPDSLREWNAINIDDEAQLREIWQHVHYNVAAIDYFLNCFVFPRHAKQFQMKLQASGWDIPLMLLCHHSNDVNEVTEPYKPLTTGFSGTNDWKRMLPLTINQRDLPGLAHTNAEVLTYLLQPRNRRYVLAADFRGKHLSEIELLKKITGFGIRVLIDAGAQILEMTNYALAKVWLQIFTEPPAAVYFDEKNRPMVLYRKGYQIPLLASPFADDLGECLVYLDEAHTRGTDLKFPPNAKGALTLGLGQPKDHTVQAAMRLRQLSTSQSVVFFAPPEVHQSIMDLRKYKSGAVIDSYDVICWLLEQTCSEIELLQPLYFSQGIDFCRRAQAALDNQDFLADSDHRKIYLASLRCIEQQTLEQLYGFNIKAKTFTTSGKLSPSIATFKKELDKRRKGFQDSGNAVHGSVLQEVEQEREISHEVEAIREVQKPVHYQSHNFPGLHKDIIAFAKTGRLAAGATTFVEAFVALGNGTALGRKYGINSNAVSCRLHVSYQFTKTVNSPLDRPLDQFQRPVNWAIFSVLTDVAVIVIPEEAEQLLRLMHGAESSPTHLLAYAAPVTRKMLHFNDFRYYSVPSLPKDWEAPMWFRIELGIFAARLYFPYSEYTYLLQYLGIKHNGSKLEEETEDSGPEVDVVDDTNKEPELSAKKYELPAFTRKPLSFLQE
ncbi:Uncharacterized protein BP5553_04462 [Venustampulla echinocandica]|uniref:ubiquitinyl hydrolase 1 n=1 Tax=Venustampulla echinocandica TaxID=2656787 RepID=A0A370TND2_9HELO|nr:Uncharacterized protein BP5553_04462 [Venustampulla echinocandica]RDL37029.1 Uncharacterized protein BP5553_04462 [Venustampulla echinocandica]